MNSPPLMLTSTAMLMTHQTLWLLIFQAIIFALGVLVALEGLLLLLWAFKLIALFPLMPTSSSSKYRIMINVQLSECHGMTSLPLLRPPLAISDPICLHSTSSTSAPLQL